MESLFSYMLISNFLCLVTERRGIFFFSMLLTGGRLCCTQNWHQRRRLTFYTCTAWTVGLSLSLQYEQEQRAGGTVLEAVVRYSESKAMHITAARAHWSALAMRLYQTAAGNHRGPAPAVLRIKPSAGWWFRGLTIQGPWLYLHKAWAESRKGESCSAANRPLQDLSRIFSYWHDSGDTRVWFPWNISLLTVLSFKHHTEVKVISKVPRGCPKFGLGTLSAPTVFHASLPIGAPVILCAKDLTPWVLPL